MAEDDYAFFMAAMRYKVDQTGMKQRELASKVGKSHQWFNAVYKRRTVRGKEARASAELQKAVAEAFGCSFIEFLQLGKRIMLEHLPPEKKRDEEVEKLSKPAGIPIVPAGYIDPDAVASAVQSLAAQYRRSDERQKWWKEVYDMMPSPTLIVKDGIVCYQNKMSLTWGEATGKPLCETCIDDSCPGDECVLKVAMRTNQEASLCMYVKEDFYKVIAKPFRFGGHDYFILITVEIKEFAEKVRRREEIKT